jgi:hypothetical protein
MTEKVFAAYVQLDRVGLSGPAAPELAMRRMIVRAALVRFR